MVLTEELKQPSGISNRVLFCSLISNQELATFSKRQVLKCFRLLRPQSSADDDDIIEVKAADGMTSVTQYI